MSQPKKRNRACEGCHRLKIRCEVSTSLGTACERCSRNGLDCVPAPPRLQRDRITELEAQVNELTNLLRAGQNGNTPPSLPSPGSMLDQDQEHAALAFLDTRLPLSKQEEILHLFPHQAGAVWPFFRLPPDLNQLRSTSPVLLLSVVACTTTHDIQATRLDVHDEIVMENVRILGDEGMSWEILQHKLNADSH